MQKNTLKTGTKFVNLTFDAAFKRYFKKTPDLLKSLLKYFLPLPKSYTIQSVEILDSESMINPPGKNFVLDIKVRLKREKQKKSKEEVTKEEIETVNVEMQTTNHKKFTDRILAYNARLYANQLQSGQDYDKLQTVYSLVFITENLQEFKYLANEYYHTCSMRRDDSPHSCLSQGMQIVIVELAKFHKKLNKLFDLRDAWCYLLKKSKDMDKEESVKLSQKGEDMKNAVKSLWDLSQSEHEREYLESMEKQRRDREAVLKYKVEEGEKRGEKRGIVIGIEEGKKEKIQEVALKMLEKKMKVREISELTGLSKKQIEKLQKDTTFSKVKKD